MAYLELENLLFKNDEFKLACSLRLEKGSIGVLLGPSGSGKTSLLRCISGLEKPESGSITLAGNRIDAMPIEKRNIGFVFQDLALFDHLDARKNIEFGMKLKNLDEPERSRRTSDLAATMRIADLLERMPGSMSGGERQRLALARSLATRPDLILLDEPLSALDAPLRKEMRDFIKATLKASSMTALHVTHDVEEALELGDVIFLMRSGKILASGEPEELFSNPPDSWSVGFLGLGIVLPALSLDKNERAIVAQTAAGPFLCPLSTASRALKDGIETPSRFGVFLPSAGARLVGGHEASPGDGRPANRLQMLIEKVSFNGRGRKITAKPVRLPESRAVFEGDLGGGFSARERIMVEYPIESCRLVILE
jgi:ABC-type Fe3+/spermidine/putrescine transport system ATPase subunit